MYPPKKIKTLLFLGIIFALLLGVIYKHDGIDLINNSNNTENDLKPADFWDLTGTLISIDDIDPSKDWSKTVLENDWCTGNGTWRNPYVIENLTINGLNSGSCIEIQNSNAYFILRNCTLYNSTAGSFPNYHAGIRIISCSNGMVINNTSHDNWGCGIFIRYSSNFTITKNIIKNNRYNGMVVRNCDLSHFSNNQALDNDIKGIWIEDAINNQIYSNQLKGNGDGIIIVDSTSNQVYENYAENNYYSDIFIGESYGTLLYNNVMIGSGLEIRGNYNHYSSINLNSSNLVNNKPLYFIVDREGLTNENLTNAGQIFLINCNHSNISDFNISNVQKGIIAKYCTNLSISKIQLHQNKYHSISIDQCEDITINKANISSGQFGIYIKDSSRVKVNNSIISNIEYGGIFSERSHNNVICSNTFNDAATEIDFGSSDKNVIKNNVFYDGSTSIRLGTCHHNKIINNTIISPSKLGIQLSSSINASIYNNTIKNGGIEIGGDFESISTHNIDDSNRINNKTFLYFSNNNSLKLENLSNLGEIIIVNCSNLVIRNCNFSDNYVGIYIHYSNNISILECHSHNNQQYNIHLNRCNYSKIIKNDVYGGQYGIYLKNCDNNEIVNNSASHNHFSGLFLHTSNNNILLNNSIFEIDSGGMDMYKAINNTLKYNLISRNYRGLHARESSYNKLHFNRFSQNTQFGLRFYDSTCKNNSIWLNEFINNPVQAVSEDLSNEWDNGTVGNYWNNYNGQDQNGDGIGDTPQSIDGSVGSSDHYPLMTTLFDDSDLDNIINIDEILGRSGYITNPLDPDSDDDLMPDGWEVTNYLDPLTNDSGDDPDFDLLTNLQEFQIETNPQDPDSDDDGLTDGEEFNTYNTDPNDSDTDNDTFDDYLEISLNTHPNNSIWYPMPNLKILIFDVTNIMPGEMVGFNISLTNNGIWIANEVGIIITCEQFNLILYTIVVYPRSMQVDEIISLDFISNFTLPAGRYNFTLRLDPDNLINELYSNKDGTLRDNWEMDNCYTTEIIVKAKPNNDISPYVFIISIGGFLILLSLVYVLTLVVIKKRKNFQK